jgi:hypothetical protein
MDASTLKHIVKSVLEGYSGESLNGYRVPHNQIILAYQGEPVPESV